MNFFRNLPIFAFLCAYLFNSQGHAQNYRASSVPDRVILTWKTDPANSQAVTWRTDNSVTLGIAEIALAGASPIFSNIKSYTAETSAIQTDYGTVHYHSINFVDLEPEQMYAYRVGNGEIWSEWFHFRTASLQNKPFSFIYFGDAQNDLKSMWSRVIRQAYSHLPEVSFMIHAGDLVNYANNDDEWGEWFYAGGWLNGMIPSIPSPGNHEYSRIDDQNKTRELSILWKPQFSLPDNGPENFKESVYFIDYQGVRIISLNSMEIIRDAAARAVQAEWLTKVLENNTSHWTCVTFHHPIYSSSQGRDNVELREAFKPIFEKYHVDLVLQGHDHTYGRGRNLQAGLSGKDKISGPMYVVSVSGPKMYSLTMNRWTDRAASETQLYQIIKINGETLSYGAYTPTGLLYDAFDLIKQADGTNKLVDKIPDSFPERSELQERYKQRLAEEEIKKYYEMYKR